MGCISKLGLRVKAKTCRQSNLRILIGGGLFFTLFLLACRASEPFPPLVTPTASSSNGPPVLLDTLKKGCQFTQIVSGDNFDNVGLKVGQRAVDFRLRDIHGMEFELSRLLAEKPVVMVFGSCT